jgi:hypothetical protein
MNVPFACPRYVWLTLDLSVSNEISMMNEYGLSEVAEPVRLCVLPNIDFAEEGSNSRIDRGNKRE